MEMLEMELIKKLQNTQAIQKDAYSELEKSLSQPNRMLGNLNKKNLMPQSIGKGGGNPGGSNGFPNEEIQ